ncbi:glycosyltransferase [Nocardioides sp. cx-169]|uniref:glycosyltransferase family 2 protein n=1 Tax=Nocardioides sp. cx-169 TaxID=2899080 RepID=UPI001E64E96D|nr:glycosyltransferase [Nocardioides sp. cx-169]MCD4532570.1 glycosyltransferase [Nocardioides sp. cx-169]
MSVTTVVVTRNRWPDLERTLPRHAGPVLLVDNGSEDGTAPRVRERFPRIGVIGLDRNHGAAARNVGVEAADTPYVAFSDDDSWWAPGSLDRAAAHFDRSPRLAVLAARLLVGETGELDPVCREMAASPLPRAVDLPGPPVLGFVACGAVVRRSAFLDAGGFDEVVFFAGEEERLALDLAAGCWGLAYVEDVVAHHHPSPRRDDPQARRVRIARNRLLTAVMRRPWAEVREVTRELAGSRTGSAAIADAVPRLPGALRRRNRLPRRVEDRRRMLEDEPVGQRG